MSDGFDSGKGGVSLRQELPPCNSKPYIIEMRPVKRVVRNVANN